MKKYLLKQLRLLAEQAAILCAACAAWLAGSALLGAGGLAVMYTLFVWALCPILGGWVTVRAVLRGMQPYLALWAMAICPAAAQRIVTGTALDMSAIVIYAFIGLICSAAGDELLRRREADKGGKGRRK